MYHDDDEHLRSLKQEDSYHFSIPFEYIQKILDDDNCETATTNMEVDVVWDEAELGYRISYYVPDMYLIDPAEGNGDADSFYESWVSDIVEDELSAMGITYEALVNGTGI